MSVNRIPQTFEFTPAIISDIAYFHEAVVYGTNKDVGEGVAIRGRTRDGAAIGFVLMCRQDVEEFIETLLECANACWPGGSDEC